MSFVNPNNPLRRGSAQPAILKSGAKGAPQQNNARVGGGQATTTRKTASSGTGARTQPKGIPVGALQKFASAQDEQHFDGDGQFNPRPFAGYKDQGSIRRAVAASSGRVYDKHGEMNAWDRRDALQQAAYVLGHVSKQSPLQRMTRHASVAEKEERRKILAAALSDPTGEGFSLVGQELLLPIKAIVDYEGWARKVYRTRPLAQAELFRIAKDVRATAYVVGQDGQSIESRLFGQYIQPSEFKITSFPSVDIIEIYQMNFDVLDRAQDTARQEIELEEDKAGLRLLDRAAQAVNTVTSFSTMGVSALEAVRYQVERHRLIVDKFLINRQELSDVQTVMSTQVDPVTQRELNMAGYFGSFLGAHIMTMAGTAGTVEEVVPAGSFYATTAPEYLGEMGIRVELFSEPFNGFNQHQTIKGWAFIEMVGFGIPNARAVAKGLKS